MPTTIEHDHFPELAEQGGSYGLAEQIGLTEVETHSATERRQSLASASDDELLHSIVGLNAVLRGKDIGVGVIEDGQLQFGGTQTPPLKDKEPLLRETFRAFKEVLANTELDDKTALRRAGLTLAGALNYIHPFKDGNGRTARLMHYFIEFGAERGEELFEAETFSILGKVAVTEEDFRTAVYTSPPAEMENALNAFCKRTFPEAWQASGKRAKASMRVQAFLDAMTGKATIVTEERALMPVTEEGRFARTGTADATYHNKPVEPGENIVHLYEGVYKGLSFAAHMDPSEIPLPLRRPGVVKTSSRGELEVNADVL